MPKEICLEGVCTSGKTTLGKKLVTKEIIYIPEYSQIDTGGKRRNELTFPPADISSALSSVDYLLILDQQRKELLNHRDVPTVLTDRGIVALLAFEYAMFSRGNIGILVESSKKIKRHLELHKSGLPVGWVYTRFSNLDDFESRASIRKYGLPFLLERETAKYLQEYYDQFLFLLGNDRYLIVEATGDINGNVTKAKQFIINSFNMSSINKDRLVDTITRTNTSLLK
ncbi:hypothetical protein KKC08_00570 [Patescibacteria group bacterium]|nr:hypothetical protein [Patescibacteria group bacterium]MCG2702167.1 hypothetical protein [Candidatus Parcubacteria bacterium]MBU4209862.1 hypothetical protein [Patescibacteria group bacterium]MBU4265349.1 hypothetical protein [Patescibacteria group bacterium]MBU4390789.1 hypothetical protein [Patescibacteria group bacterium]